MQLDADIFSLFDKKWALLTAGEKDNFNTMTISWGGLGTLWGKSVATVYVRKSRYTHKFMDQEDYFTVSFYPDDKKQILGNLGSKSGRDIDKINDSGLTAKALEKTVTFAEAEVTLVCKKIFMQELSTNNMPNDIKEMFYGDGDNHDMYIGEVVEIIKN